MGSENNSIALYQGPTPGANLPRLARDASCNGSSFNDDADCEAEDRPVFGQPRQTVPSSQYPIPRSLSNTDVFEWDERRPLPENLADLGNHLAQSGDLFRNTGYGEGLLLASPDPHIPSTKILDASTLDSIVTDRLRVRVVKDGKYKSSALPARVLKVALTSELFLQQFLPVDRVDRRSSYLPDFTLTTPGYNDGGFGHHVLLYGSEAWIEYDLSSIPRFLDVMSFESEADRTNSVAAALTVMHRHSWPGGKPCLIVTSSKSHGGKETVITFAAGNTRQVSVSYERVDWALQKAIVESLKQEPDLALIDVENARLEGDQKEIASAFLERLLTDREPSLYSPGTGPPVRRANDFIVAISTNHGSVPDDLMNRGLPIHLNPVGDVAGRVSPIGNPKLEYLPAHRDRIEAELRGMVERWKREDCPLDGTVKHPFGLWAQTIGGILMVNRFTEFLANYGTRKTALDPVRQGLGLLGVARPNEWLRTWDWAAQVCSLGLLKALIQLNDRDTDKGRERGIGVTLSAHVDETFSVGTEDKRIVLQLKTARRRFETGGEPHTRYKFEVLKEELIPEDQDNTSSETAAAFLHDRNSTS
jgi:hypothetical protein